MVTGGTEIHGIRMQCLTRFSDLLRDEGHSSGRAIRIVRKVAATQANSTPVGTFFRFLLHPSPAFLQLRPLMAALQPGSRELAAILHDPMAQVGSVAVNLAVVRVWFDFLDSLTIGRRLQSITTKNISKAALAMLCLSSLPVFAGSIYWDRKTGNTALSDMQKHFWTLVTGALGLWRRDDHAVQASLKQTFADFAKSHTRVANDHFGDERFSVFHEQRTEQRLNNLFTSDPRSTEDELVTFEMHVGLHFEASNGNCPLCSGCRPPCTVCRLIDVQGEPDCDVCWIYWRGQWHHREDLECLTMDSTNDKGYMHDEEFTGDEEYTDDGEHTDDDEHTDEQEPAADDYSADGEDSRYETGWPSDDGDGRQLRFCSACCRLTYHYASEIQDDQASPV